MRRKGKYIVHLLHDIYHITLLHFIYIFFLNIDTIFFFYRASSSKISSRSIMEPNNYLKLKFDAVAMNVCWFVFGTSFFATTGFSITNIIKYHIKLFGNQVIINEKEIPIHYYVFHVCLKKSYVEILEKIGTDHDDVKMFFIDLKDIFETKHRIDFEDEPYEQRARCYQDLKDKVQIKVLQRTTHVTLMDTDVKFLSSLTDVFKERLNNYYNNEVSKCQENINPLRLIFVMMPEFRQINSITQTPDDMFTCLLIMYEDNLKMSFNTFPLYNLSWIDDIKVCWISELKHEKYNCVNDHVTFTSDENRYSVKNQTKLRMKLIKLEKLFEGRGDVEDSEDSE